MPFLSSLGVKLKGKQGSGFHTYREFSPPSPPSSSFGSGPKGTKSCRTQGTFLRPFVCSFVPPNPLKTGIWASRLEFGPRDWDLRGGGEKEGGGEGDGEEGGENSLYV